MFSTRSLLLAACAGSLVVACGGGGSSNSENVTPEGTHHGYVVSKASAVPEPGHSTSDFALDLGSAKSSSLDGHVENKLGDALVSLASFNTMLNAQPTIDTAVTHGSIILLVDFQSKDFSNSDAGLTIKFGSSPTPPACDGQSDTTCGHHLMGGASFQLASNSPADAALAGKLQGGTFNGGPGEISLAIAIGTTDPIVLPLVHARARATSISDTGISVIVGGLLSIDDLRSSVGEALQKSVTAYLAANCTNQTPPGCGCSGLAGDVITLLDGSTGTPADCKVSVDELLGNPVVGPLLSADSCSTNSCTAPDSISVGIKLDAVPATF